MSKIVCIIVCLPEGGEHSPKWQYTFYVFFFFYWRHNPLWVLAFSVIFFLLNKRLSEIIENKLGDFQMGFRPNRSTIDNIFLVRQIFEKCYEYNIDVHNIFVDYSQAFDSVNRNKIIECLTKHEVAKN
jgi:hypothetical protein